MRKGTKKIRYVTLPDGNSYYVYDLDVDMFGKIKRIYGHTEGELKEKIDKALQDREVILMAKMPASDDLKSWVQFYLKTAVGQLALSTVKRYAVLCENSLYGSHIDINLKDLDQTKISAFIVSLLQSRSKDSVLEIDEIIRRTFDLAKRCGRVDFIPEKTTLPADNALKNRVVGGYIPSPAELDILLDFCLLDDCKKYSTKELVIAFMLLSGLRVNEILPLKISDFHISKDDYSDNNFIAVGDRKFSLDKRTVQWLKEQEKKQKIYIYTYSYDETTGINTRINDADALVFTNKGAQMIASNIQHTLRLICNRCGLNMGINTLTVFKGMVARLLNEGMSADAIAQRYGITKKRVLQIGEEAEVCRLLN